MQNSIQGYQQEVPDLKALQGEGETSTASYYSIHPGPKKHHSKYRRKTIPRSPVFRLTVAGIIFLRPELQDSSAEVGEQTELSCATSEYRLIDSDTQLSTILQNLNQRTRQTRHRSNRSLAG